VPGKDQTFIFTVLACGHPDG